MTVSAPSLFRPMLRHEWRLFRADGLLAWVLLTVALATGYAVFNGHSWVARQNAGIAAAQAEEASRLAKLKSDFVAMAAGTYTPTMSFYDPSNTQAVGSRHAATSAALPTAPLAATSIGQSDLYSQTIKVSTNNKDTFLFGEEIENPANLLTGAFDLSFVVVFLLPLLVLALSYNMVSGEKEQGTLALVMSNPVPLSRVLWAKVAFRAVLVVGATVVCVAAGLALGGLPLGSPGAALSLLLWGLLVAGYAAFWFALAVAVNLYGKGSAQNALMLVGLWIVTTLVAPTLIGLATAVISPVPSRSEMVNNLRTAQTSINKDADATQARFYQDHPELDSKQIDSESEHYRALRRLALQNAAAERVTAEIARYDTQLERQQAVVDWLRFLSPAIVMQQALNDVAGTGTLRYKEFTAQVNAFHARWQAYFLPRVMANQALTLPDYAQFPRFAYREAVATDLLAPLGLALLGLLFPTAMLLWWCRRRIRRFLPT